MHVTQHFREAVGQETALVMNPLPHDKQNPTQGDDSTDGGGAGQTPLIKQDSLSLPSDSPSRSRDCELI